MIEVDMRPIVGAKVITQEAAQVAVESVKIIAQPPYCEPAEGLPEPQVQTAPLYEGGLVEASETAEKE